MATLFPDIAGATFSEDRVYRYRLWRNWDIAGSRVLFLGLNPSTADEVKNDPTVTRCINYAKKWGFSGMYMGNIFGLRSTDPKGLLEVNDPIGAEMDNHLLEMASDVDLIVAAWGNHGKIMNRSDKIRAIFPSIHCLRVNKSGEPQHPLYLSADLKAIPYNHERKL